MEGTLISEGAEARIYLLKDKIVKDRIVKRYRDSVLDERLRRQRNKREARVLQKAKTFGVNVPCVYNLNLRGVPVNKYRLEIEYIDGDRISLELENYSEKKQFEVMNKLGCEVAKMHSHDIIHGDLTTSNTLLRKGKVYLIDFGLGFISHKIEDKAVDLHLIKQALEAKHWKNHEALFLNFLRGYSFDESDKIIERLKVVERRGRYKR